MNDRVRELLLATTSEVPVDFQEQWAYHVEHTMIERLWARPGLPIRSRGLVSVAATMMLRSPRLLAIHLGIARSLGISRRELEEVAMQVAGYGGLAAGYEGLLALAATGGGDDDGPDLLPGPAEGIDDPLARGMAVLAILQPRGPATPGSPPEPFAPDWQPWLLETAFGELWARPGLALVDRELITIAVLVAIHNEPELRSHLAAAVELGVTPEELGEVLMHVALYTGFPAAVAAMRVATDLFAG